MAIPFSLEDAAEVQGADGDREVFQISQADPYQNQDDPDVSLAAPEDWGHVKICVLALLLERPAETNCGRSWSRIKQGLRAQQISYFSTAEQGFYRTNELTNDVIKTLKSRRISPAKAGPGSRKTQQESVDTRQFYKYSIIIRLLTLFPESSIYKSETGGRRNRG